MDIPQKTTLTLMIEYQNPDSAVKDNGLFVAWRANEHGTLEPIGYMDPIVGTQIIEQGGMIWILPFPSDKIPGVPRMIGLYAIWCEHIVRTQICRVPYVEPPPLPEPAQQTLNVGEGLQEYETALSLAQAQARRNAVIQSTPDDAA